MGAAGYAGQELLGILGRHGGVEPVFASSESCRGEPVGVAGLSYVSPDDVHPGAAELVFLAVPHGRAAPWVERLTPGCARIVDLTADHRPGSGRENVAVYGLAERAGSSVDGASLVANPGCYPTGVLLALQPLEDAGLLDPGGTVVVNAASGVTGAGRRPRRDLLFAEVAGDYRAYGLGNRHRHLREIRAALPGVEILFTPHLLPAPRGILETMTVPVKEGVDAGAVREAWAAAYGDAPAIRLGREGDAPPRLSDVAGTDRLHLWATDNRGLGRPTLTVLAALDNLGKGAAGQAVQNMNRMLGFARERGLRC